MKIIKISLGFILALQFSCDDTDEKKQVSSAVIDPSIYAIPGQPVAFASEEQKQTFVKGETVAKKKFTTTEGLGPIINVTFCGACHEKPVFGGSAGLYRNFYLQGERLDDGSFSPLGPRSGVLDTFSLAGVPNKIQPQEESNWLAMRNPIPFFGVGLIAEISEENILKHADPDDENKDGISGKPNYDRGYVGRFGMKAQTVSIENFIRGPLFNHLGLTSNPLPAEMQAKLPVPSVAVAIQEMMTNTEEIISGLILEKRIDHQAAAPSMPLKDDDMIPDPELSSQDLYDLVSWAMLLGAPKPSTPTQESLKGKALFEKIGCTGCHIEALESPRGLIPLYSDLLLHDMGEKLADGIIMNLASGNEFRTQPLWGVSVSGPFLHDGRAHTLKAAILEHGGEGQKSRDLYEALSDDEKNLIDLFLKSLGGEEVATAGLILPSDPVPSAKEAGGPLSELSAQDQAQWLLGRQYFDAEKGFEDGIGPMFNGDSCRACHFQPFVGGAGPIGVSAVRYGIVDEMGVVTPPETGSVMRRFNLVGEWPVILMGNAHFEVRQSMPLFGLKWIEDIKEESILANEDADDVNGDGIKGVSNKLADGTIGRFGWKAQISSVKSFVADALAQELNMTIPENFAFSTARFKDEDQIPDPEVTEAHVEQLTLYISQIHPPKSEVILDEEGQRLFNNIGCVSCHIPKLEAEQPYAAYTDLLLHDVQKEDYQLGFTDGSATARQFRTSPLWGISQTAPYWHDGRAVDLKQAILEHDAEGLKSKDQFSALNETQQQALINFLNAL